MNLGLLLLCALSAATATDAETSPPNHGMYSPVEEGWSIALPSGYETSRPSPGVTIGVTTDNARQHRRPLYPPADKALIWSAEELAKLDRCGFRPLVLAYNEPRFLFDFHSAGGLLGHLYLGLLQGDATKWFHRWDNLISVCYTGGRMEYKLRDPAFPGATVRLSASALAHSAGLIVKINVEGLSSPATLVWAYGGASAFFTNYNMGAAEFTFAPEHCAKDTILLDNGRFSLRRAFDKTDVCVNEVFSVTRRLPEWKALVQGGSSWAARLGFGAPASFAESPAALRGNTQWMDDTNRRERQNATAVQEIALTPGQTDGYVVIGMGGDIQEAIAAPAKAWEDALARNRSISERVVVHTQDPPLDAAVRMMAFATEGTWGDSAILHGAWSWRFAYLGWRGWYGSACYGWLDRVKQSIQHHTTLGRVAQGDDQGALGSLLEYDPGVFYNMNEVFFDQTRQYFDYTNDLELMREIYPVLEGIAAWEDRRLQPGNAHLYENALNTWISDSHWYIGGQCTQASAYMLRAYTFLAELAQRLGYDAAPHQTKAAAIRQAMQDRLWMPDQGVFAEYRDTRGAMLLHPEPELPTIYHSAEFGAADNGQIHRMLLWADSHLRRDPTPGDGRLVWSSNWFPNRGRTYTHSTYELAYGENLNYALTNWLAGRSDIAYALLRASLCGIFNGPTPGGLACHSNSNGTQRANDEFTDAISMWGRAVVEGLFGIVPKLQDKRILLSPQFPLGWEKASISTPLLSYNWRRHNGTIAIEWTAPQPISIHLHMPLLATGIHSITGVGGDTNDPVGMEPTETGFDGLLWANAVSPEATHGRFLIRYTPGPIVAQQAACQETAPARVWKHLDNPTHDLSRWALTDLGGVFNSPLTEVLPRVTKEAKPPAPPASQVGFGYWRDHLLQYHGSRNDPVSDAAWRAKVDVDGVAWTSEGIPFKSAREGANIAVVTRAGGFPEQLAFPVNATGTTLYLMLSGMTFPAQSHVPNLRVSLQYSDGTAEVKDLVNPFDIGDCWGTWCGRFHDVAANGFENIGGRKGPAGSAEVADLTKPVDMDTEAQLLAFDLRPGGTLEKVSLEAIANDAVFGIMGATILK